MLPALIFSLIPSSHTLPAPQASGLQHTDCGAGERQGMAGGRGGALTETLLVLLARGEMRGELPVGGPSHRAQGAVGGGFTRS